MLVLELRPASHGSFHACKHLHSWLHRLYRRYEPLVLHLVVHALHIHLCLESRQRLQRNVKVGIGVLSRVQGLVGLVQVLEDLQHLVVRKSARRLRHHLGSRHLDIVQGLVVNVHPCSQGLLLGAADLLWSLHGGTGWRHPIAMLVVSHPWHRLNEVPREGGLMLNDQVVHRGDELRLVKSVQARLVGHIVDKLGKDLLCEISTDYRSSQCFLESVKVDISSELFAKDLVEGDSCAASCKHW